MDALNKMFIKGPNDLMVLEDCDIEVSTTDQLPTAEDLLRENIVKANKFLDLALTSVEGSGITSLWAERIAKLIDSITLAAEKIIGAGAGFMDLEIKRDLVTLKTKELELKSIPGSGVKSLTQNVFQMTREDALALLRDSHESQNLEE
jgi:hypothetical protein